MALYPIFGLNGILFPLVARAVGLMVSLIGILAVRGHEPAAPMTALNRGYYLCPSLRVREPPAQHIT